MVVNAGSALAQPEAPDAGAAPEKAQTTSGTTTVPPPRVQAKREAVVPMPSYTGPAAELVQLKFLLGTWRCQGQAPASALGAERKYLALAQVSPVLDGAWYQIDYEQRGGRENPTPQKVLMHWGYDSGTKQFVRSAHSNYGTWDSAESSGWTNDTLIWTGETGGLGGKFNFKNTVVKKSDKEVTLTSEIKVGNQWLTASVDNCRK